MKNPIKKIRDQKEVTQHELALAAGVSVSTVRNIESGQVDSLNPKLVGFLEGKGYDGKKLESSYGKWLAKRKKEIEDKF